MLVSNGATEDDEMISSEVAPCVVPCTSVVGRDKLGSVVDADGLLRRNSVISRLEIAGPCVEPSE